MDPIKNLLSLTMKHVDNGQVLKKPVEWLFYFFAWFQFVLPLVFVYYLIDDWDEVRFMLEMTNGWDKFCGILFLALFVIYIFVIAYVLFLFWMNRAKRLAAVCPTGSTNTAIRVCAFFNQCQGESISIYIASAIPVAVVFLYLYAILTGVSGFYHDGIFLKVFLGCIVVIFIALLISYFILLWCHFFSEFMSALAKITDDVSDLSDIHRAATFTDQKE